MTKEEFDEINLCKTCVRNKWVCWHKLVFMFDDDCKSGCRVNGKVKKCEYFEKENENAIHD